jgi:hypothetical protein
MDDDERPMDPAESLRLIEHERAAAERSLTPDPRVFLWPWGVAWVIGFTVFFLRYGPDGRTFVNLPDWLPLTLLLVLSMAAGVFTGIHGARTGRWVSGPSSRQGAMYGIAWSIAFTSVSAVVGRVSDAVPEPQVSLLWAGVMVGLVGTMHMAGGAIYQDVALFALGAYICLINVVGVVAGPGWHSLIVAVAGGGGMLVAGALARAKSAR